MDLKAEFAKRGPWVTRFVLDGIESGGKFEALADHRIDQFFESFPNVRKILELGSLEGGHTFALARRSNVERVLGVEARAANIAKARFVQELLHVPKVEFVEADLEKAKLEEFGKFDAVFCSGVLYHLAQPWKLIEQAPRVASRLFIWTHYAEDSQADVRLNGLSGKYHDEGGKEEPLSGMSPKSFWLTLDSLQKILASAGFNSVRILDNDPKHSNGPAVTIAAKIRIS
jgi:SAM-dependent methyltransferase